MIPPQEESIQAKEMTVSEDYVLVSGSGGYLHMWRLSTETLVHVVHTGDAEIECVRFFSGARAFAYLHRDAGTIATSVPSPPTVRIA